VVGKVKEKLREAQDKQWKFEINGKEVVVRDLFKKTLDWVEKLAPIFEGAVELVPGPSALVWAGIHFLLKVKPFSLFLFTIVFSTILIFITGGCR
jgi:hypothetical protein